MKSPSLTQTYPSIQKLPTSEWNKLTGTKVNKQFFTGYQVDGYQQL